MVTKSEGPGPGVAEILQDLGRSLVERMRWTEDDPEAGIPTRI